MLLVPAAVLLLVLLTLYVSELLLCTALHEEILVAMFIPADPFACKESHQERIPAAAVTAPTQADGVHCHCLAGPHFDVA